MNNYIKLEIMARGENESFARNVVAAFAVHLNPTLSVLADVKTAVSEAVTNCIVHAYPQNPQGKILIECTSEYGEAGGELHIRITDYGCGIKNTKEAIAPFYTSMPDDERTGMGFTIMQTFMDEFSLTSELGKGTVVDMVKKIASMPIEEVIEADRDRVDV